ncbi:hypothetical protein XELAEV_18039303mg [Xenopus laevis]|uniref:Uncharacterized protein n=1 Tax=Xenopus laevis TaxID=8355 RepID=A0A974C7I2_XENLA|nr:hypothetical protein XELAEV_18039303mg [Xenopus laevis]
MYWNSLLYIISYLAEIFSIYKVLLSYHLMPLPPIVRIKHRTCVRILSTLLPVAIGLVMFGVVAIRANCRTIPFCFPDFYLQHDIALAFRNSNFTRDVLNVQF